MLQQRPPKPPRRRGPRGLVQRAWAATRRIIDDFRSWKDLRHTPYGMTPAVVFGLTTFFQIFDSQAFRVAGPDIIREFGIDLRALIGIQQVVGFFAVFGAIGIGWYADRHRRLPLFVGGTAVSGAAAIASGFGRRAVTLGAARVLDDTSNLVADVPQGALLADYYPIEARGRVFAVLGTVTSLGTALALPITGASVTYLGLSTSFVIFGIPIVLMAGVGALKLREPVRGYFERKALGVDEEAARKEDDAVSFGEAWRTVWAVRTVRRLFVASVLLGGARAAFFFYAFFLTERYGLNAFQRAIADLPFIAATIAGGLIGGGLMDRFGARDPGRAVTVLGAYGGITAVGLLGLAAEPPLWVVIVSTSVFAFGSALVGPATNALISQVVPPNVRAQGLQMVGLATLPSLVFLFPLAGLIHAEHGYGTTFLFGVPFIIVGALLTASAGTFFEFDRRSMLAKAIAGEEWRRTRASGQAKLLVCRDVDVEYGGVQVLFGVDFDVEDGEIIALLGTNGAGKSTLLRAISGGHEASSGAIVFDGRDITHMPPHEVARRGVILMSGGRGVFPGLTVAENILLGNWMTPASDEVEARVSEVYELFPVLAERAQETASSLSGGEQQMLALAQAFMAKPRLLMIDELSLGLSPAVVGRLLDVVRAIHARGVTVILVEQSVNVALSVAEKAIFMEKGEVKFFGRTADLLARPDILRAVYVKGTGALTGAPARRPTETLRDEQRELLSVEGVSKRFGGIVALDDVGFSVRDGEVLGVIGPNGSGKTTLFEVIGGYQHPDAGVIRYDGVDITGLSAEERSRRKLVRRFQDARLFPSLTVFETLLVALDHRLDVHSTVMNAAQLPGARRAERRLRAQADRLIELLELGSYRDKFVKELSTGLRRIVDIAWVLAQEPRMLLLDEPSSGIAQAEAEGLAPLLRRVRHETGCGILIIEHDMPLISAVSDELLALERGRILTRGAPEAVLNDDRVIESYLGGSEAAVQRSGRRG